MSGKYYIESGSFRITQIAPNAKVAICTSIKRFFQDTKNQVDRLSEVIVSSQKGFPLELFDGSQLSFLTKEETICRQQDYVIVSDIKEFSFDPTEDIIFLQTQQVFNYLGLKITTCDFDLSIYKDELNVR